MKASQASLHQRVLLLTRRIRGQRRLDSRHENTSWLKLVISHQKDLRDLRPRVVLEVRLMFVLVG